MDEFDTQLPKPAGTRRREPVKLKSQIAAKLRDAIIAGEYLPGDPLNEAQLAKSFNVSRIPIREALIQLWESGLVMQNEGRGLCVTILSDEDIQRINDVRLILEAEAVWLARSNITAEGLSKLQAVVDRMKIAESPSFEATMLDLEFHRLVWNASGNPVLAKVLDRLLAQLFAFKGLAHRDVACVSSSDTRTNVSAWRAIQHHQLLEVLRGRSAVDPTQAILSHMSDGSGGPGRFASSGVRKAR